MYQGLLGEVRLFAGPYAPVGWAYCDGSILQIRDNMSLFGLIGPVYGGDGVTTFALPKLDPLPTTGPGATPVRYAICTQGIYPPRD